MSQVAISSAPGDGDDDDRNEGEADGLGEYERDLARNRMNGDGHGIDGAVHRPPPPPPPRDRVPAFSRTGDGARMVRRDSAPIMFSADAAPSVETQAWRGVRDMANDDEGREALIAIMRAAAPWALRLIPGFPAFRVGLAAIRFARLAMRALGYEIVRARPGSLMSPGELPASDFILTADAGVPAETEKSVRDQVLAAADRVRAASPR